jgi:hypothetical protein
VESVILNGDYDHGVETLHAATSFEDLPPPVLPTLPPEPMEIDEHPESTPFGFRTEKGFDEVGLWDRTMAFVHSVPMEQQ